jgi:hypothetical protein
VLRAAPSVQRSGIERRLPFLFGPIVNGIVDANSTLARPNQISPDLIGSSIRPIRPSK